MNRTTIAIVRGLVVAALLFAGSHTPAQTALNNTPVCGSLSGSITWAMAGSPYDVCASGVTVPAGMTLTIDPGVTVQFAASAGNKLNVRGALVANGTITQTITLTSLGASPGSWGGISAVGTALLPARLELDYASLNYGGIIGSYGAQVYADQAVVTVTNSLIQNSAGNGMYISMSARLDAHATSFINNAQHAIQLNQPSTDLLMTGLTATGNGTNGVFLEGGSNWRGQRRWTYPGLPYIINANVFNDAGDVLKIDPGNTLEFTSNGWMNIRGRLEALGTPTQPITMTGRTKTPGAWLGILINSGAQQAVVQLDYVTVEYGGNGIHGANIEVANGRLIVHHSIIRHSLTDGVRIDNNSGSSILESQIISNTLHGVRNLTPALGVLATNNWWGDADGPQSDVAGCSTGLGSRVSGGVFFTPVLTGTHTTASLPLSSAPILTLTPRSWFAPANGVTKIYIDITVRDGNGVPIPGRTVKLSSTRGTVFSGGITGPTGKTLAYLTSTNAGDAVVTATFDPVPACVGTLAPETKITFTTPVSITDLLPNAPASYFDGDIEISPLPVVTGISTTMTIKLTNPLTTSLTVDVSFGFAQSGIGLVFGPIKDIVGQVIPANSSVLLSASFLPVVSGHYCVQVSYAITAIGQVRVLAPQADTKTSRNRNLNVFQGSTGPPSSKDALNKADKAFKAVSKLPSGPTQIQKGILGAWWGAMKDTASDISKALGFDPPRQDYNQVTMPVRHPIPQVLPDINISVDRAAALNAVNESLTDIEAFGTAATTAMDRYGGASEANNLQWASEQANELLYYEEQLGTALLAYADRLDAFVQVLQTEGETEIMVTVSDITSYQQRLTAQGFTALEIANAKLIGWTDADIEAYRLEIIAAKPSDVAGNLLTIYTNEAVISRALGNALLHPPIFDSSISVSGSAGHLPSATGNVMAQVYDTVTTIQLSNPLTQTAQINVSVRRIDLPADWAASASPAQITLAPGQQTTVVVTVAAGSPVPQGSRPRIAVEGHVGSLLLGGVVIDIMVPTYMPFDGRLHIYLPAVTR